MKLKRKNNLLIVYLFFFIFAPPIIPKINVNILQAIFSLLYLICHYSKKEIRQCIATSNIYSFLKKFILIVSYFILTSLIGVLFQPVNFSNYINTFYGIFLFSVILMINIVYIIMKCKQLNFNLIDLLRHCIYAGLIQSFIAIIMLMFPHIRNILNQIIYANTGSALLQQDSFLRTRAYAFSNDTVDLFGYGVGILAGIAFYFGIEYKKRFLVYSLLLIVLTFLNARTGLVMAAIGVILCILQQIKVKGIKFIKYIVLLLLIGLLVVLIFNILKKYAPATVDWVIRDMEAFIKKMKGVDTKYTVASQLFSSSFWKLPGLFGMMFGTGHSVYGAIGYSHSDVGYVNLIWQIGFFGMITLMQIFGNAFWKSFKLCRSRLEYWLVAYTAVSFYIFNIKGGILTYSPGVAMTMLIVFAVAYFSKIKSNKVEGER